MGTHPIFESDFDCLTDKMVKFDDVSKACDDLFKKPFNSGKVNVDIKSGAFTLKNSCKGGAMSSNLEMKMNDALFGLAPNFALPCTKKFDGKKLTFEFAKSFNDLKLAVDTTFTPASGALGNVVKADYNANGITAGVKASVDNVAAASFHITTAVKNQVVGVKGALNNPTALSLVYAPSSCLTVNTDMTKYDISYHLKGDSHQVGLQWGWIMGSDNANFGFAAKKTLANGADFHIKSDLTGQVELAHVSKISVGEFDGVKCTLGAQVDALNWGKSTPVFGAGFEFNF